MAATTYTGTGATLAVSNAVNAVSFQPDLVWVKSRSQTADHGLQDSVRGTPILYPNLTSAESAGGYWITSYNSNGFTMNTNTSGNNSGSTYVGWQWNAGGTTVTNGVGTISSQVRANTTAGFSVVTYTGTGVNATVGHGLGVAPSMVIVKKRSAVSAWIIGFTFSGFNWGTDYFQFDTAAKRTDGAGTIFTTTPSSTVFSIGVDGSMNTSSGTYVAYCWAPIAGYSAFGSYTGNGSADGPFIYTGFRPRWIMIKGSGVAGSWSITDTSRDTYNLTVNKLEANTSLSEASNAGLYQLDILSNGFKIRQGTGFGINNAADYIYAAFAENPLKYANAR
jgi:hypothetical protein